MLLLVLGFYDRGNIGDESYKKTLPLIFGSDFEFHFKCTDDVDGTSNVSTYDAVLCGGGDVINGYFIDKIIQLKSSESNVGIPFYAISVGISYNDDARLLALFDHVFVRSSSDYDLAIAVIGEKNVSFMPDAAFSLSPTILLPGSEENTVNIVVAPAYPVFRKNNYVLSSYAEYLRRVCTAQKTTTNTNIVIHLVAFNTGNNEDESDIEMNKQLTTLLSNQADITVVNQQDYDAFKDPTYMLDFFRSMDLCICMRYHSIIFAVLANKPFSCAYISKKIANLLIDISNVKEHYCIPHDEYDNAVSFANANVHAFTKVAQVAKGDVGVMREIIFSLKFRQVTVARVVLVRRMYRWVSKYLTKNRKSLCDLKNMDVMMCETVARIVSYAATGDLSSRYVWGLMDKLLHQPDHKLIDSFDDILRDHVRQHRDKTTSARKVSTQRIRMGPSDDFKGYHRSGWEYAMTCFEFGDEGVMLDNFVDRTFSWANDTLESTEEIPYRKPWVGFVHHTFTKHSRNNLHEVFDNIHFRESLKTCLHLFALSADLASKLRTAVNAAGFHQMGVSSLVHPTETPELLFSLKKFQDNRRRKVVHIGAWLRNPYAIYDLPIHSSNELALSKAALKGIDMDAYFPPARVTDLMSANFGGSERRHEIPSCACRSKSVMFDLLYIPDTACRLGNGNKFVQGMIESLAAKVESVEVIASLNNDDYDGLLSENIVFIQLVDCSAVNTVIECIVRNTPIFVNRLPALEEILGQSYPGFYDDLFDAAKKMNMEKISEITSYMERIDKTQFSLQEFKARFFEIFSTL